LNSGVVVAGRGGGAMFSGKKITANSSGLRALGDVARSTSSVG
jgi:hypothetical protein